MNKYLSDMKEAVKAYQAAARETAAKIKHNNEVYKADVAAKENARLMAELKEKQKAAHLAILDARDAGEKLADSWGTIAAGELTGDEKLLELNAVDPTQFRKLAEKYRSNGTMTELLHRYADRRNKEAGGAFERAWNFTGKADKTAPYFDTSILDSVEKRKADYKRHAGTAIGLVDGMSDFDGRGGNIGVGPDSQFLNALLDNFGSEVE